MPEKINSFDIRGQSNLIVAPEWKRTLPRAFKSHLGILVESTPEGTRYIKELPPSSRRQATVHRTIAFYCSSPFYLEYKNGVSPKGYTVFGTPEGTRTPNPRNRNPMLYPLSHWRIHLKCLAIIADKAGFVKSQMAKNSLRVRVHPERTGVTPLPGRCAHRPAASGRRCWGRPSSGPGRSCSWGR